MRYGSSAAAAVQGSTSLVMPGLSVAASINAKAVSAQSSICGSASSAIAPISVAANASVVGTSNSGIGGSGGASFLGATSWVSMNPDFQQVIAVDGN
ncbi:unnamed protein product [Protopolystoma xenopodis]|uniref:Uncharacterized protein n=1 Tax=Protopolystoma xenopodis TaxID=117903 RepID=A0A448X3A0_9PLAT|nr:unnamed protein product [Protopolystoma xenopodis]